MSAATFSVPAQARPILEQPIRKIFLHNAHTEEVTSATYWKNGTYNKTALRKFDFIMRDRRTGDIKPIDPALFDLLHKLQVSLKNFSPIDVVCGYRSPATNNWLASFNTGVAKHSYHMQGKAVDIRIPGVPTAHIHNAALALKAGGVGYYPENDFVHIDTGPVRTW